jgi:hypothetical protein
VDVVGCCAFGFGEGSGVYAASSEGTGIGGAFFFTTLTFFGGFGAECGAVEPFTTG